MQKLVFFLNTVCLIVFLLAAGVPGYAQAVNLKGRMEAMEQKFNHHLGFSLYDPGKNETIFEYKSDKYFTPASNTKIYTMLASLEVLGDSVPGLYYLERGDSLIIWGSGDPSFLYENTAQGKVLDFLQKSEKDIYLSYANFYDNHYGPNWAWDDFSWYYQVEKTSFPIYGNYLALEKDTGDMAPVVHNRVLGKYYMQKGSDNGENPLLRDYGIGFDEILEEEDEEIYKLAVPFKYTPALAAELLSDTLHRPVYLTNTAISPDKKTIYSVHVDSLYQVLMQESDNFIAEQLLLLCSGVLTDSLKSDIPIRHATETFLADLPDEPVWVDGSGLSRYNLFTPRTMVAVWEKMYRKVPKERLFPMLAIGGEAGTIEKWYKGDRPYIYGKTGTLRNNHSLSGFLVTSKGSTLIFSFMHSNYTVFTSQIKKEMERILLSIRDNY